jgi:hypothetical protein
MKTAIGTGFPDPQVDWTGRSRWQKIYKAVQHHFSEAFWNIKYIYIEDTIVIDFSWDL